MTAMKMPVIFRMLFIARSFLWNSFLFAVDYMSKFHGSANCCRPVLVNVPWPEKHLRLPLREQLFYYLV